MESGREERLTIGAPFLGAIFVAIVAGRRKMGRNGKIAALLLCVGMLAFKYLDVGSRAEKGSA